MGVELKVRLAVAAVAVSAALFVTGCGAGEAPAAQTVTSTATATTTLSTTTTETATYTAVPPTVTDTETTTETAKPTGAAGMPTDVVTCAQESGLYTQLAKIYHLDTFDDDVSNYSDDQVIGLGRGIALAGAATKSFAQRFDNAQLKKAWEGVAANAEDTATSLEALRLNDGVDALIKYIKSTTSAVQACNSADA
ncbi:hypothetical protein [Nakamurella endophytica]|uniref:Lipoprotein n=1 Tax=Nakamurella endophytica TaxID=1748367 RepID=A0A917TC41_9ACTN|nr:hypothetical protein [Nakamurella endophytica]GGM17803.1 hypothetical protein GCM10011594_42390 [Nakamurella endophytica]